MPNQPVDCPIVITTGEPAGCGPDIVLRWLAQCDHPQDYLVCADINLLKLRAKQLRIDLDFVIHNEADIQTDKVCVLHHPLIKTVTPGNPLPENASYVLNCLQQATQLCLNKKARALVTAPLDKYVIRQSNPHFTGHTEFLRDLCQAPESVMLLTSPKLRVALVTTHIPLRNVADALTKERLTTTIKLLDHALKQQFKLKNPHILVCGLNPHAGEQGELGDEEQTIILPVLNQLKQQNILLTGPVAADTAFLPQQLTQYDAVLAMYHDQGLTAIKSLDFEHAVNTTLGLPIIRTSVDHGTAYDLAGSNRASITSLAHAIELAKQLSESNP